MVGKRLVALPLIAALTTSACTSATDDNTWRRNAGTSDISAIIPVSNGTECKNEAAANKYFRATSIQLLQLTPAH